ncbi:MAG: hypothetical protein AMS19_01405 [Gemmatimonas sp. SG8_23]|nr:MAG: hypothetical protein AMS19_01405 [Gemmatimonas sp. SG8_23]
MPERPQRGARARAADRWFSLILRVYPESFRRAYGRDARELFSDQWDEASRRGVVASARLLLAATVSTLTHGVFERLNRARSREVVSETAALIRLATRRIVRTPLLSGTIVVTLGLGIGADTALYSLLRSVLVRPLPYPEADRLVQLWELGGTGREERTGPSPWNFIDWSESLRGFASTAAWYLTSATFRMDGWAEEVRAAQVTPDFFRTLGVEPILGRAFRPGEVDRYGPVVLSHALWSRRFGADPGVLGRTVVASGRTYTVVGVMPPAFAFPDRSVEAWIAWDLRSVYSDRPEYRGARFLQAVGRLAPGSTLADANAELGGLAAELERAFPAFNRGWGAQLTPLHEEVVREARGTLWVAFGAVSFILLIACANVANLLLARVPARSGEVALRAALGASRRRIAFEVGLEHAALGLAAGVLGFALATGLVHALVAIDAGRIPRLAEVSVDGAVLAFTVAVAFVTTLLFGAAPLSQLMRASGDTARSGRSVGTRGQGALRTVFVGAQLAIALVLLVGAALFTVSLQRIGRVDPGLDPTGVATFRVSLDPVDGTPSEIVRYYRQLEDELRAVPGVLAVGASQALPLSSVTNDFQRPYRPSGSSLQPADAPAVNIRVVTAGYMEAMGMRLLDGQGIPSSLAPQEPLVAVLNRTLAERLFPDGGAVGSVFEIDFREGWQPYRVAGVVANVRHYGPRRLPVPEVFLAHDQVPYLAMTVAVRTSRDPQEMFEALEATVRAHRPLQPPHHFATMEALLADATAEERFLSLLLAVFGAVGLLLAGTGVYAVIAYSVGRRRREIGVRIALGAAAGDVLRSVLSDVARAALAGVSIGVLTVLVVGRAVDRLLFEVSTTDPVMLAAATALLLVSAGAAAFVPARRATRVEPGEALRTE